MLIRKIFAGAAGLLLTSCGGATSESNAFFVRFGDLCDKRYEGQVVSQDAADTDWRKETLVVGPINCELNRITMPLAVGADKSRTWYLTRNADYSLTLKHRHLLKNGDLDPVTNYGGTSQSTGTVHKQDFPVDAESIALFEKEGLTTSVTNIWSLEFMPSGGLAYTLKRENRHFRAEFSPSPLTAQE